MNFLDPARFPNEKYGVGQSVTRKEDGALLTGAATYTDDLSLEGQAIGLVLRSPYAHGVIRGIGLEDALGLPGVVAIYTGADLAKAGYGAIPCPLPLKSQDGTPLLVPARHGLAVDKVRHAGEAVALIVAESLDVAKDAAELVELDVEPLPVVTDPDAARAADAPQLFDNVPGNLALDWRFGDWAKIEEAFAKAAHVTRLTLRNNRVVVAPMEPRAAIADYDAASDRMTLHVCSQGVFGMRNTLANAIFKVPPEKVHVMTYSVGGSFGMKVTPYPEYIALMHAARALGRPVKWCDERADSFVSDHHGRDSAVEAALALDAEGNILAVTIDGTNNAGAYIGGVSPIIGTVNILKNTCSLYRTPLVGVSGKIVLTNTTPIAAYRGAGRPEGNYYMERLIEAAARETGRDPVALRRRNMILASAIPYTAPSGLEYDSGDFAAVLDDCLKIADWDGFAARKAASEAKGLLRGRGLACYLEVTAPPGKEMGGIRFEPDGGVAIVTGTLDYGQGHHSAFAQVLVDKLGIPFDRIRLVQGDSDQLLAGGGTGGSRSSAASGTAIVVAGDKVIEQGRALAGHFLEAAAADIEFTDGTFRIAGTDREIAILDLARKAREANRLPDDLPQSLDAALVIDTPPSSFPNGAHIAEVEIDPETGVTQVVRYSVVDDFGNLINPMLVEGQVHGGVTQGIGQALMENAVYDADGNLVSGSFMDYAMPHADEVPSFAFASHPVPATTNPLGVKGCGEAGVSGALPSVMNAVIDALSGLGVRHIDMPATPERVWRAIAAAKAGG
jgi:carbon-monoxide dehydrogenase large subunit